MKRPLYNVLIDAISFLIFSLMIATGLILKFILPPGSGRIEKLLQGGKRAEIVTYFDLTRHEWGEIHFYISLIFLLLLLVHLILHWQWIKAMLWGTKENPRPLKRKLIILFCGIFLLICMAFPWIVGEKRYSKAEFIEKRETK